MRDELQALPYTLLRGFPRRGRFRLAVALRPRSGSDSRTVTLRLRGGLRMRLDLGDHLQRAIAADCFERPEEELTVALLRPGDHVIDVGANVGFHSLRWAQAVGPSGRVVAFEPAPPNHEALLANLALNPGLPVEPQPLALGDRDGTVTLSSDRPGATSGSYSAKSEMPGGFPVRQTTLDGWARGRDLSPLRLVKVDVEGWEARFLQGAQETLRRHRPYLLIEWNSGHGEGDALSRALTELVADLRYDISLVDRSRVTGRGTLGPLPDDRGTWPSLCNVLLRPRP